MDDFTSDFPAAPFSTPEVVSIGRHRHVSILKVPKFIGDQWRAQPSDSIVAVLLDPEDKAGGSGATIKEERRSSDTDSRQQGKNKKRKMNARTVVISSESVAAYAIRYGTASPGTQAADGRGITARRQPSGPRQAVITPDSLAAKSRQISALRSLRALQTQALPADHLHVLSVREERKDGESYGHGYSSFRSPSISSLFDDKLKGNDSDDDEEENEYPDDRRSGKQKGKNSSALDDDLPTSQLLNFEASVSESISLVPPLDSTYHVFLHMRNVQASEGMRATKVNALNDRKGRAMEEDNGSRLFRYYSGAAGEEAADPAAKKTKTRRRGDEEPGGKNDIARQREEDLKEQLFDLFEKRQNNTEEGPVTMQDLVKLTSLTPQYLKGIVESIADPVRTFGDRKRVWYQLKPEFSQG